MLGRVSPGHVRRPVGRAVVDDDDLEQLRRVVLGERAVERLGQVALVVVRGDDPGHEWKRGSELKRSCRCPREQRGGDAVPRERARGRDLVRRQPSAADRGPDARDERVGVPGGIQERSEDRRVGGVERDRRKPGRGVVVRLVRLHRIRERLVGVRHDADVAVEQVRRRLLRRALAQEVDARVGGDELEQLLRRPHPDEHDLDSGVGQSADRVDVETHRERPDVHRPRAGNRGEIGRLGLRVDRGSVPVVVDAVADIAGVRHVVDRPFGQSAHDVAGSDQLPADLLQDPLWGAITSHSASLS